MKWKIDRIISLATLAVSLIALVLVLKRPRPVAEPQPPAAVAANAQSFQNKLEQFEQPKQPGEAPAQVRLSSDEVSAALNQAVASALSPAAQPISGKPNPGKPGSSNPDLGSLLSNSGLSPDAQVAGGEPEVKDYQVNFDGDVARGQFVVNLGGKNVYVTLAGHLGAKDGFATFDPTEFKVGDLNVPVSLVNDALQKKLAEQRDRLRLPDNVGDLKVENGQLVMTQK